MQDVTSFYCRRLFTPTDCLENTLVEIRQDRIVSITSDLKSGACDLDASSLNAAPGFVDLHIQGCGGFDFLDATPEAVRTIRRMALAAGCTSLLATTTFEAGPEGLPHLERIVNAVREGSSGPGGSRILGIHLEGPYLNKERKGGFGERYFRTPDREEFLRVLEITGNDLKMITLAPELNNAMEIIREARSRGIVVSLGHSIAGYDLAKAAFHAGASQLTHVFNAMNGLHHREPGLLGAALEHDHVFVHLIPDGIHIHPAVMKILHRIKGTRRICLISDATAPCGLKDGTVVQGVGGRIKISDGAVRLEDGTLAGSALLMDEAVRRMHRFTSLPVEDALTMASLTPAEAIGFEKEIGSALPGMPADFVLFDDDLRIHYVILEGNVNSIGK